LKQGVNLYLAGFEMSNEDEELTNGDETKTMSQQIVTLQ
jgi:hypothetical protein